MNEFRERLLSGKPLNDPLLRTKQRGRSGRRAAPAPAPEVVDESLDGLIIPREVPRTSNHRDGERHRLLREEEAVARWNGEDHEIEVVNLSGGGAMISAPFKPYLWDRVDLQLGSCGSIETAVRWIKGRRLGLEFAHETQIDADPDYRNNLLREVIARSFPAAGLEVSSTTRAPEEATEPAEVVTAAANNRNQDRHPLIWNGLAHYAHDSRPVRLRNISAVGALVQSATCFPLDAELLLDLGDAGSVFATVQWAQGDQSGLRFHTHFDLSRLARAKPDVAPSRWVKPAYLRDEGTETSPWASRWGRLTVDQLRRKLDGQPPD